MLKPARSLEQILDHMVEQPRRHGEGWPVSAFMRLPQVKAPAIIAVATIVIGVLGGLAAGVASAAFAETGHASIAGTLSQRSAVQLVDARGRWLGALPLSSAQAREDDAFVPVSGSPPQVLRKAVLYLEDKNFLESGPCGIPWLSAAARVVTSRGRHGGSGVHAQIYKALSEGGAERSIIAKIARKVREVGSSCAMARLITRSEAADLYISYAPYLQGPGTTRGASPASQILFGRELNETTVAQQLILAAAVKRPISRPGAGDAQIPCTAEQLPPRRRAWCSTIARARVAARVLEGPDQRAAIAELNAAETLGPTFEGAPIRSQPPPPALWNAVTRPPFLLPGGVVPAIRTELLRGLPATPEQVQVTVSAESQSVMTVEVRNALRELEQHSCVPLIERAGKTCGDHGAAGAVLAIAMRADGRIDKFYGNGKIDLDDRIQIGSVAKLAGLLALVRAGVTADDEFCPKTLEIDGRAVRRASSTDTYGVTDCTKSLLTLEKIIARSDNLAFYEALKTRTSATELRQAADDLGFAVPPAEDAAYALSFGTAVATPRRILMALQRLISASYHVRIGPPRLEETGEPPRQETIDLVAPDKVLTLRRLLGAPASHGGTMSGVDAIAAKTGTLTVTRDGRMMDRAKLVVWSGRDQVIRFALVSSSDGGPLSKSMHWRQMRKLLQAI